MITNTQWWKDIISLWLVLQRLLGCTKLNEIFRKTSNNIKKRQIEKKTENSKTIP